MPPLSKTQLDKLGTRLKEDSWTDADLRLLDGYRRSFAGASDEVMTLLRMEFGLAPTARPAKSTTSIIDKLKRESVRLTQIQDIAGCRVIVEDVLSQDRITEQLRGRLQDLSVVDRRKAPSHGYRAVHVIARVGDVSIEVQIRTELQHRWAEVSEKFSDLVDSGIKYGLGDERIQVELMRWSELVARYEQFDEGLQDSRMDSDWKRQVLAAKQVLAKDLSELLPYLIDLGKGAP